MSLPPPRSLGTLGHLLGLTRPCATGKTMYPTLDEARRALAYLQAKAERHAHEQDRLWPLRAYQCDGCGWFHLTSKVHKGTAP